MGRARSGAEELETIGEPAISMSDDFKKLDTPLARFERTTAIKIIKIDNENLSAVIVNINYLFRQKSETFPMPNLILNLKGLTGDQSRQILDRKISLPEIHDVAISALIDYIASRANCAVYSDGMDIMLLPLQFPNVNKDKFGNIIFSSIREKGTGKINDSK
jgi:hypothetical protein